MSDEQASLFGGPDVDEKDEVRLTGQLMRVMALMRDGKWRTLQDIAVQVGGSEAGVSARLRDLRKPAHGAHRVEREKKTEGGLWQYRVFFRGGPK